MTAWVKTLLQLHERGEPAVLVTVAATRGSAPREAGTAMVVGPNHVHGTIGGGHLELRAIEIARDLLREPRPREMRRFPLGASLGQCCGGIVELLFERIGARAEWLPVLSRAVEEARPVTLVREATGSAEPRIVEADPREHVTRLDRDADGKTLLVQPLRAAALQIRLFGAGHVGRALVRALAGIDCRIVWADERSGEFPPDIPGNVIAEAPDAPVDLVHRAAADSYFIVMTHSHALDFELSEAILRRGDFRWFGLIGSLTKRRRFEQRLAARGLAAAALARMVCPIGVAGIKSKEPAAIAVAVAAQILQVYEAQQGGMERWSQGSQG
jgi:xanthine dehydrogenase accessory factor